MSTGPSRSDVRAQRRERAARRERERELREADRELGRGADPDAIERRAEALEQEAADNVEHVEHVEPRRQRSRRPPVRAGAERPPRRPRRAGSDLLARILVAVPLAIVAVGFVDIGGLPFALLIAVISVLCMIELYRMLARWRPVPVVGYAAAVAMALAARYGSEHTVLEIAMIALPVTFLAVVAANQGGMSTLSIAGTLLGIYWIGLGFSHAVLLREVRHGTGVLIDVMVGTFLADTGAYFGGRLFGRRPLAPEISPNKTVEGLFLGMLVAILSIFVAGLYESWMTEGDALALGVAVAVLGPIGDLFESVIKRDAGAKDAGTLFGAHGGALDRLDAILFTVLGGYYVWVGVLH